MENNIKIRINKNDELPVIAAKVFSTAADEIVLVVPRLSKLSQSVDNLKFLKNGLVGKEKTLMIESVDDQILELAKQAGINAHNPFFNSLPKTILASNIEIEASDDEPNDEPDGESETPTVGDGFFTEAEKELDKNFRHRSRRRHRNFSGVVFAVLLLGVAGWFMGFKILPQADITVTAHKTNWNLEDQITIEKGIVAVDLENSKIPGQVFSQTQNVQMTFPTTNESYIKQKATGSITIYNAYSSQPQPLVATTRFKTPDGKIVRINKGVTVPGAKIVDGKIIPSSIEAEVTADQPGEEYNVGPVAKLTIPGFEKTPEKFNGFYGELKRSLIGGFVGKMAAPTEKELAVAEEKTAQTLKESLKVLLTSQIPSDFETLKDGSQFEIIKSQIDTQANKSGEFTLFVEAKMAMTGFRKNDLLAIFSQKLNQDLGEGYNIKSYDIDYQAGEIDLEKGEVNLAVNFSAIAEKFIDPQDLKTKVAGKSEDELRAAIFALPELEAAQVSLWPFWVGRVPKSSDKIKIVVD